MTWIICWSLVFTLLVHIRLRLSGVYDGKPTRSGDSESYRSPNSIRFTQDTLGFPPQIAMGPFKPTKNKLRQQQMNMRAQLDANPDALIVAAGKGDSTRLQLLLAADVDLEARDRSGRTALICAAQEGHTACTQLLINAKAKLEMRAQDSKTALLTAALHGNTECVRLLLQAKANINTKDPFGYTSLMATAGFGHAGCLQLLLDSRADLEMKCEENDTALIIASRRGYLWLPVMRVRPSARKY